MPSSRGSSQPRAPAGVSYVCCIDGQVLYRWRHLRRPGLGNQINSCPLRYRISFHFHSLLPSGSCSKAFLLGTWAKESYLNGLLGPQLLERHLPSASALSFAGSRTRSGSQFDPCPAPLPRPRIPGRNGEEGLWITTSAFLPGESHGWRSLEGYSPWGHKESDTTE